MRALRTAASLTLAAGLIAAGGAATGSASSVRHATSLARVNPGGAAQGLRSHFNGHRWAGQQTSTNWSGYVATGSSYSHVSGTWHVPTVTVTPDDRYSSTWVGIGGDPTEDLIQAGTEQDSVGGATTYSAWTEILPEPESVAFSVNPGDLMSVDIKQGLPALWTITLRDETTGQQIVRSTPYPSLMMTAEWIHEAPTVGGFVANLAHTNNAVFDLGTVNGGTPIAGAGGVDTIVMDDNGGNQIATPGALDSDGDGFAVADGASAPPAPAS